jgi:hypothetical protein
LNQYFPKSFSLAQDDNRIYAAQDDNRIYAAQDENRIYAANF